MPENTSPQALLQRFSRRAKKSLGQNFLIDEQVIERIADNVLASKLPIIEIGPGCGALTQALLRHGGDVLAIEKDRDAVAFLKETFNGQQLSVIEGDILEFEPGPGDWAVVGNLPYNISTQVYFHLLPHRARIRRSVFMFQREVAQRFVATPRTPSYGILSVFGPYYHKVRTVCQVQPGAFRPVPKVHSTVLSFQPAPGLLEPELESLLHQTVKRCFANRRKTLTNNLKGYEGLERDDVEVLLNTVGVRPNQRAEELDLAAFCALTKALASRAAGLAES